MRNLFLQVKYWTYFMSFGPNQPLRPSTWKLTNGSDSGRPSWNSLKYLHLTMYRWIEPRWVKLTQWSSQSRNWIMSTSSTVANRYRHQGAHRDATGRRRQTRAGVAVLRAIRETAWENHMAFLMLREPGLVGIGHPGPENRAYRKLAPAVLNRETAELVRRQFPEDDL